MTMENQPFEDVSPGGRSQDLLTVFTPPHKTYIYIHFLLTRKKSLK